MILFFRSKNQSVIAAECTTKPDESTISKLCWLFDDAQCLPSAELEGYFAGPRREMITPWSTNAVEITQNMGIAGITRIEEYFPVAGEDADIDPMLQRLYRGLNQQIFTVDIKPQPIIFIDDLMPTTRQKASPSRQKKSAT